MVFCYFRLLITVCCVNFSFIIKTSFINKIHQANDVFRIHSLAYGLFQGRDGSLVSMAFEVTVIT